MTEHTRLFYSFLPHPSSELHTISFFWIPYYSRNIVSKFESFSQSVDWMGNRFIKFFFRRSPVSNRFIGSSGLLANGSVFSIFCALVQAGLSPSAPDGLGGWFYVWFGPFFRVDCNPPWIHVDSWRAMNCEVIRAAAHLGKMGTKWVGVSRLKVGNSRAEDERKWGGTDAEDGSLKEGRKYKTFGREKRGSFWEIWVERFGRMRTESVGENSRGL